MYRGGGRSRGGLGCGSVGGGSGAGAASRLKAAAESRRTTPVAHRPLFSWLSTWDERSDCRSLYRHYMKTVRVREEGEDDHYCIQRRQELEDLCSQYKPAWSGWWTEQDDKDLCKERLELYNYFVAREGPESNTSLKMGAERVCSRVRTPSPSSSSPSLMGYLTAKEVLDYCI